MIGKPVFLRGAYLGGIKEALLLQPGLGVNDLTDVAEKPRVDVGRVVQFLDRRGRAKRLGELEKSSRFRFAHGPADQSRSG